MMPAILSSLAGKLTIGSVVLATTAGGAAATGNLPDPAQEWAHANVGSLVVFEIPGPDENADQTARDVVGLITDDETGPVSSRGFGEGVAGVTPAGDDAP